VQFGIDMAQFPGITDDVDFCKKLLAEECVFVLPGQCFAIKNFCRIVFSSPMAKLVEAYDRMEAFCARHRVRGTAAPPVPAPAAAPATPAAH
jgi:tyrosine aminotransferase